MRAAWAVAGGLALGIGVAWWLARDTPEQARRKQQRAEQAAAANARDARPSLYRWRDAAGNLHVTGEPPRDGQARGRVERLDVQPHDGIEVHGDRQ